MVLAVVFAVTMKLASEVAVLSVAAVVVLIAVLSIAAVLFAVVLVAVGVVTS
jgi:hypothetical protein